MMRNLLLLLGESPAGAVANAYARGLARRGDVSLTALAGIVLSYIEAPMLGTIGGAAYHARMESGLQTEAERASNTLTEAFARDCAREGIPAAQLAFKGDPFDQVTAASALCDLIVAGHDVTFRGTGSERNSDTLSQLLHAAPRPVLVCPDVAPAGGDVLVAYDGSLPAMRALQLFVLLGCWADRRITVVSVDTQSETAERLATDAQTYLSRHGYAVSTRPITSGAHPSEVIDSHVVDGFELLVMGAYGRRGLKEFIFGSTTQTVVGLPKTCIFLYH